VSDEDTVRAATTTDTPRADSDVAKAGDDTAPTTNEDGLRDAPPTTDTHRPGDRVTVDLQDRVDEIGARMADIQRAARDLDQTSAEYREHAEEYEELAHAKEQLEWAIGEWGGSKFTIVKFDAGRDAQVNNLIRQEMDAEGVDDPAVQFDTIKQYTVQVGVVESPPQTPGRVAEFPIPVREFLYEKCNNLNRYGEVDLADFSLSAALNEAASEPN
jgi:hypothetical protein